MTESLTIFTSLTPSYSYSAELRLAWQMLQQVFPNANWVVHTPDSSCSLKTLVHQHLPNEGYLLFIKEPAMLVDKSMLPLLKKQLTHNPDTLISLPNDPPHASKTYIPDYHTLRGFELFNDKLAQHTAPAFDYDGRECWVFLTTPKLFLQFDLPDDPFQLLQHIPPTQIAIVPQAYAHPFYNYYNETRTDLHPFIPTDIDSLLDIGCSRGGFAMAVKKMRQCRVAGIEINRHEAESAKQKLDAVWTGDALSLEISEKFDCISCLDVLEHMPEPEALLQKIKQWLKPDGQILLNVPNVGFWAVVEDLLAGRWDYVPVGILCNTHLRFYTLHSLKALLDQCGYTPIRVERQTRPLPTRLETGFDRYQATGLDVDYENLATNAFTVLAKCTH